MEYRPLGKTGISVSALSLGTANFADPTSEQESIRIVHRAVDAGINLIDTADSYAAGESERFIGKALAQGIHREKVLLATKVFYPTGPGPNDRDLSRVHIMKACEDSLRHLQTDYIDIYQVHRPSTLIPPEETLEALTELVNQGKVRHVGCSTHPAWKVMEALKISEQNGFARFILEQSPYNLLDRRIENELVPLCKTYELGILAWAPLAQGVLAGRYSSSKAYPEGSRAALRGGIYSERVTDRGIEIGNRFIALASDAGMKPSQLAILWVKEQEGITAPLIGPRTLQQLDDLLPVADKKLDIGLREACDNLVPPGSAVANFFNSAKWMKARIL